MYGNKARNTLHTLLKHFVYDTESIYQRCLAVDHLQQPVVGYCNKCVYAFFKLYNARVSTATATFTFKRERLRYNCYHQRACLFGRSRNEWCGSCTSAATFTKCNKDHIGAFYRLVYLLFTFLSRPASNFRVCSGAKAPRSLTADVYFIGCLSVYQRLSIRIDNHKLHSLKFGFNHAVYRGVSSSTNTDYFDPG